MSQKSITRDKTFQNRKVVDEDLNYKKKNSRQALNKPSIETSAPVRNPSKNLEKQEITFKKRVPQSQIQKMLLQFGEFPEKHRFIIWKTLLQIPENKQLFEQLLKKGEHPSIEFIKTKFPIKDAQLFEDFLSVMSAIGFWSPVIVESEFIPAVVFPFVKLSRGDLLGAFELSVSLIWNWLHDWFENFPNAPVRYLLRVEDLIITEDPGLIKHLHSLSLTPSTYLWPVLKYLFTQVTTREEVSIIIDHLLTFNSKPQFLEALSAAYILYYSSTLKSIRNTQDIQGFFIQQNPLIVKKLLAKAQSLLSKTQNYPHRLPLLDSYPTFSNYPDFALSLQISIREKLVHEDEEIHLRKSYLKSITQKFEKLEQDDFKHRREQEALIQSEVDRRKQLISEEQLKIEERKKLDEDSRKLRLAQIQRVEDTAQKSMASAENLKRLNDRSREDEQKARGKYDSYLAAADQENENLSLLEFKAAQRLLEIMRVRNAEESKRKLRQHSENWDREQDEKERILKKKWLVENEQRRIDLEMIRENKVKEAEMVKEFNHKRRMDTQQQLKNLERELKLVELEKEKKLRVLAEEELMRNEEYLLQLRVRQELVREQDERQFQILLQQEKEYRKSKNDELLMKISQEQKKQAEELQRAREENERIERELENQAIDDKANEMRREIDYLQQERERMVQETLEKIERERNETRRVEEEINRKRNELKERNAHQKIVRDHVDEAIQKERELFWKFRDEAERENQKIEMERKEAYDRKMNLIIRQREETLAELSRPTQKVASSLKDRIQEIRGYSDEESEQRDYDDRSGSFEGQADDFHMANYEQNYQSKGKYSDKSLEVKDTFHRFASPKSHEAPPQARFTTKNYEPENPRNLFTSLKNSEPEFKLNQFSKPYESEDESSHSSIKKNPEDRRFPKAFESGDHHEESLSSSGKHAFNSEEYSKPSEFLKVDQHSKLFLVEPKTTKLESLENSESFRNSRKTRPFDYLGQNEQNFDYRTKKIVSSNESPEKQASSYQVSDPSEDDSNNSQDSHDSHDRNLKLNEKSEVVEETSKSQELFDMQKISEFTKDMKTKKEAVFSIKPSNNFMESMKKIEEEPSYSKESESSGHFRPDRRRWEENSYSKCSSNSCESSELSYHRLEIPKENKFFISKTQKPDVEYSENWDHSDSFSSCHSHECSSCVYSSSECSCDYSSKESSQRYRPPGYQYTSSDYSDESFVRRSSKT
jgi:hypothetical protein